MAARQREISVSEFFTKNRHLLGFDNPQKALLTTIKEAVDNSLDACEEAGILPTLKIEIQQLAEDRFRIAVEDNGPGIVKAQIPKIFGKLLYGSKFHTLKQARGQQGIGISAAGMYGLLTTGKSVVVISRTAAGKPAHYYEIQIDTRKNAPQIITDSSMGVGTAARHAGRDRAGRNLQEGPAFGRRLHPPDRDRQSALRDFLLPSRSGRRPAFPAGIGHSPAGAARDQAPSLRRGAGRSDQDDEGDARPQSDWRACSTIFRA